MYLKSYLFILFIILLSSGLSGLLLIFYMSPERNIQTSLILMGTSIFLASSSLLSLLIFFIKKLYYRGDVSISTLNSSVRQSILITAGGIMTATLYALQIFEPRLIMIVWAAVSCLEVMAQAVE